MKPEIKSLPFEDYLNIDAISNSYLSRFAITPAHAAIPVVETPAMAFGTAFHVCILEPETFANKCAVAPAGDRRTKAGKTAYAEFVSESLGKTIISADSFEAIQRMGEAINNHPMARALLKKGIAEQSVFWVDDETGLACKARPDWLTGSTIVDLKKTKDASELGFSRSIVNFRYYQQAAFYLTGLAEVSDTEYEEFFFIAVNDQPPYEIGVYSLSQDFLEYGYYECRRLLRRVKLHSELGLYPNYKSAGVVEIAKPGYLV